MIVTAATSAFIVVLRNEPEARRFLKIMLAADEVLLSAGTYVEAGIVADAVTPQRRKPALNVGDSFDQLIKEVEASIVPVTESTARTARAAYRRYGKGQRTQSAAEFRGLLLVRVGHRACNAFAVQRHGLCANGYRCCHMKS